MKPLNRPMFKNGGPIKEGIMSGMKEPQAINTVGSPLAPQDSSGRQGYAIPILGALIAGARALPTVYRGIRAAGAARTPGTAGFFRNLFPTGRFRNVPGKQQSPSPEFIKGDPTAFAGGPGPDKVLGLKEAIKNPFLLGKAIRENPITAFTAASAVPQTAFLAGKGAVAGVKSVPDLLKGYVEAVLPGKQFDDKEKTTEEDSTGLKKVDKFEETEPKNEVVSQEKKDQLIKDNIEENRKRYYKLMGIDKMKKGAAYDSLIDASRIIQEQGGDLKGNIKSGNLQSAIISAISKNLDKSTDLKKQIDAAVLKGEIEKDINKTKLTSFQEQIKFIKENPNDPLAKKLAGATSVADIVAASAAQGKSSTITSGDIASMIDSKGTDVSGTIADDEYQKWFKSNKNKDEIDFFIEKYSGADDGLYVVNKKAFIKRGNEIAPISLDSIIG